MMRKLLTVALSVTLIAALAACGAGGSGGGGALSALSEPAPAAEAPETSAEETARPVITARAEWTLSDIEKFRTVVTGITDREYGAGEGSARQIREDITYDREFVYTVLLNTASVRFDTPGGYPMTYWVYFDAAALADRTDAADMGFDIPDADRLAVAVHATVTVTDPEEDEGDGADEGPEETEAVGAVTGSSGGGSGSGSGSSSKSSGSSSKSSGSSSKGSGSSASACDHVWYEVVDAETGEHLLACDKCNATKAMSGSSGSSGSSSKSSSSGSSSSGSSSKSSSSGSSGSSSKSSSSGSSSSGSSGSSSGSSGSSSSSGSQAAGCSHVWVEVTEEVAVRDERYVCNNCGYASTDGWDVANHATFVCNCGYSVKNVVVGTQTVGTGTYVCSKCGATK